MKSLGTSTPQPLTSYARIMALVVVALVFLAGVQLYILAEQTDRYFAWTITAPVTAAFLGGGYWSALVAILYGLRQKNWVNVRSTLPTAFTATTLLLIATLLHIDKFHLTSPIFITWLAAWIWIVVYIVVPPTLLVVFILQSRTPGTNPPRQHNLPHWISVALTSQAVLAILVGFALFLAPQTTMGLWPWQLTPLTARAIGSWMCAVGATGAIIAWEDDLSRVAASLAGFGAFGIFQFISLFRYQEGIDWRTSSSFLYVLLLLSISIVSAAGLWMERRRARMPSIAA